MPDSVEHRVAIFKLTRERDAKGLPKWLYDIDLRELRNQLDNNDLSEVEYVRAVAQRVKASAWATAQDRDCELDDVLAEMAECEDKETAEGLYDRLYDLADYDRAWLRTC